MAEQYFVPAQPFAEDGFVEKHSKFTGRLWQVETAEQATEKLKQMRERYWDATHHCWAYLLREGNLMRYSDDGEPQGTAGMPILEVLRGKNLSNCICVVTRYFGGIQLGTGGLVRAYTKAAQLAVAASGVQCMSLFTELKIDCPYQYYDSLAHLLPTLDCSIEDTDYGEAVVLYCTVPQGGEDRVNLALAEKTAGRVQAEIMQTKFMGRRVE